MATYQQKIDDFLKRLAEGPVELDPKLLDEFGEDCKKAIIKQFTSVRSNTFSLRMSNIGHNLRQLHMQKLFGRQAMSPDTKMRMLHGDIVEALGILIVKSAGIKILEQHKKVVLDVDGFQLPGELDLIVENEDTGEPEIIDIKSTSYARKFVDIVTLAEDDSFGYLPQLFGYAEADKKKAGGFWVFDKLGGAFKSVEVTRAVYDSLKESALKKIKDTVNHFRNDEEIPPCPGFTKETFYGKETGNYVLSDKCKFCDFKELCHIGGISHESCRSSKAKDKPMKWYKL